MKASLICGGGMGDCIWRNYENEDFLALKSIKEFSNPHITLYIHSHNDQTAELFKFNPYIDDIISEEWGKMPNRPIPLMNSMFNVESFKKQRLPVFLAPHEEMYVDYICKEFPNYVAVHPFAGQVDRNIMNFPLDIKKMIDQIISAGNTVVLLGGDSTRVSGKIKEKIDYKREGLINLINKIGVRASTELCARTKFFIGSQSCYLVAAVSSGVRVLAIFKDDIDPPEQCAIYLRLGIIRSRNPNSMIIRCNEIKFIDRFIDKLLDVEKEEKKIKIFKLV